MDFHILGVNKNETKSEKNDEIGQMLVSGALDDTKTIGKAGADIFANFGADKPCLWIVLYFPNFPWI